jgi:hypothetical protein
MQYKALQEGNCYSEGQLNFIFSLRFLFVQLAIWTRAYICSVGCGSSQSKLTAALSNKLYSLPVDFYNIFKLVFGENNSQNIINLLSTHIITLETVINAQKNGDSQAVNDGTKTLYENANEISQYLAQLNPFWKYNQWINYWYNYIQLTLQESTTLFTGDYDTNINIFDRIILAASEMGDYMADGIISYLQLASPSNPTPQK